MCNELPGLLSGAKTWLQFGDNIVIETKISGCETLFENRHARKKAHRFALHIVGWRDQHLAVSLEKRSRDPAINIFGKSDGAVFQGNLNPGTADGGLAHAKDSGRIEFNIGQLQVKSFRRATLFFVSNGLR